MPLETRFGYDNTGRYNLITTTVPPQPNFLNWAPPPLSSASTSDRAPSNWSCNCNPRDWNWRSILLVGFIGGLTIGQLVATQVGSRDGLKPAAIGLFTASALTTLLATIYKVARNCLNREESCCPTSSVICTSFGIINLTLGIAFLTIQPRAETTNSWSSSS